MGIFYPIKDDNNALIGFAAVDIAFKDIPAIMESYKLGSTGYSILVSKTGDILYHPDQTKVSKEKINEFPGDLGGIGKKMIAGESGVQLIDDNGESRYIGYAISKDTGWSVGLTITEREVLSELKSSPGLRLAGLLQLRSCSFYFLISRSVTCSDQSPYCSLKSSGWKTGI